MFLAGCDEQARKDEVVKPKLKAKTSAQRVREFRARAKAGEGKGAFYVPRDPWEGYVPSGFAGKDANGNLLPTNRGYPLSQLTPTIGKRSIPRTPWPHLESRKARLSRSKLFTEDRRAPRIPPLIAVYMGLGALDALDRDDPERFSDDAPELSGTDYRDTYNDAPLAQVLGQVDAVGKARADDDDAAYFDPTDDPQPVTAPESIDDVAPEDVPELKLSIDEKGEIKDAEETGEDAGDALFDGDMLEMLSEHVVESRAAKEKRDFLRYLDTVPRVVWTKTRQGFRNLSGRVEVLRWVWESSPSWEPEAKPYRVKIVRPQLACTEPGPVTITEMPNGVLYDAIKMASSSALRDSGVVRVFHFPANQVARRSRWTCQPGPESPTAASCLKSLPKPEACSGRACLCAQGGLIRPRVDPKTNKGM